MNANDLYSAYFLIAMQFCRYDKFTLDVNSKSCVVQVYECLKKRNNIDNGVKDCVLR